ncbi:hypothetical protein PFISCL1PPCAC_28159, partial [Pristionchus fissidentatus]
CECGNESVSNWHVNSNPCGRAKSIVLIKSQDSRKYGNEDISATGNSDVNVVRKEQKRRFNADDADSDATT